MRWRHCDDDRESFENMHADPADRLLEPDASSGIGGHTWTVEGEDATEVILQCNGKLDFDDASSTSRTGNK